MMMQAIRETKVNMSVYLGVYIGTDERVNTQQMQETLNVLQEYSAEVRAGRVLGSSLSSLVSLPSPAAPPLVARAFSNANRLVR